MITRTRYRKQRHKKRHKRNVAATVAATVAVLPAINLLFKIMRLIIRRIKYSWLLWTRQKSENKHVTWALKGSDWKRSFLSFRINLLFYSIFSLPTLFKYQFWKEKKRSGMFILICISYEVNILVALLDLTLSRRGNEKAWKKSGWLFFKRAWPNIETIFAEKLDELDNFRPAFYV